METGTRVGSRDSQTLNFMQEKVERVSKGIHVTTVVVRQFVQTRTPQGRRTRRMLFLHLERSSPSVAPSNSLIISFFVYSNATRWPLCSNLRISLAEVESDCLKEDMGL